MSDGEIVETPRRAVSPVTPDDLIRIAIETGAGIDYLERLMALKEQAQASQARREYDAAFTAFKDEAVRIIKNRSVTDGPLKGKRYAELFAVVNAITPALSRHNLSASWKITKDEKDWIEVTCTLKHVAGHFESVSMGGPPDSGGAKNAIQARASTVSYLERYTLKAITGLSEQDDDDDGGQILSTVGRLHHPETDEVLDAFRAASLEGTEALRKHYDANVPSEAFWKTHGPALRKAAAAADKDAQAK